MELKDVVLSTLAEMEDNDAVRQDLKDAVNQEVNNNFETVSHIQEDIQDNEQNEKSEENEENEKIIDDELNFLTSIRERLLVLFEGFQAPNNTQIEAKVDMTLNFLEYTLASIDNRLEKIKKGDK